MNMLIFDYEVFKYDTLLGALVVHDDFSVDVFQTWSIEEMKNFYLLHSNDVWIGHNNAHYDNFILQACVAGKTSQQIKKISDDIVVRDKRMRLTLPLIFYDLMNNGYYSLKVMEAFVGKNIYETEVDFNLDRPLTDEEKHQTEEYNKSDLEQTFDDFNFLKHKFKLRLDIISEFGLDVRKCLNITGTQIAEEVLHAERIDGIGSWYRPPVMWPTLQVKNQEVIDWYMSETWRQGATLNVELCGVMHKLAAGGIHGAVKKRQVKEALYFDVSGYYNLIMINLDLLPRSIPTEYRAYYEKMYHQQLEMKKTGDDRRGAYKTILLSVFGAMNNEYCRFYDPYNGDLVRLSGQMYLVDLLEHLEGMIDIVQSNTDGVIAIPANGFTEEQVKEVIDEWQNRTHFVLKVDKIYNISQRDVNNYCYQDDKGEIHTLGEAVTHYNKIDWPFWKSSFNAKEPIYISHAIVEYFIHNKLPEETLEELKSNLRYFQYICKKLSFDWLEYEVTDIASGAKTSKVVQNVNRAFAMKSNEITGMLIKHKYDGKQAKVSNLPDSVFIYNDDILSDEHKSKVYAKIDWQYYIDRAYERIAEFIDITYVKGVLI